MSSKISAAVAAVVTSENKQAEYDRQVELIKQECALKGLKENTICKKLADLKNQLSEQKL